jgi:hypothetical protein
MTTYTEAELAGLTLEEQEALRADADADGASEAEVIEAADPVVETVADSIATEEPAAEAVTAEAGEPAAELGESAGEGQGAESAEFTPKFTSDMPEGVADRLLAIQDEKAFLVEQFNDGQIDMPTMMAGMSRLDDEKVTLVVAQENAKFAERQNDSLRKQRWEWEQERFFGSEKNATTYADPVMVAALDSQVKILAKDPANASRKAAWFLEEADRLLRLRFSGAAAPDAPDAPAVPAVPAVQPVAKRELPPTVRTLSGIPAAAPAPVSDDVMGKIRLLQGEDLEKYVGKMPTADVDKLLRSAA